MVGQMQKAVGQTVICGVMCAESDRMVYSKLQPRVDMIGFGDIQAKAPLGKRSMI
jgi:hypothetical protein